MEVEVRKALGLMNAVEPPAPPQASEKAAAAQANAAHGAPPRPIPVKR
jgi:hypothetical protein